MWQRLSHRREEIKERIVDEIAKMTGVQVGETKHLQRKLRMLCSTAKEAAPISEESAIRRERERERYSVLVKLEVDLGVCGSNSLQENTIN